MPMLIYMYILYSCDCACWLWLVMDAMLALTSLLDQQGHNLPDFVFEHCWWSCSCCCICTWAASLWPRSWTHQLRCRFVYILNNLLSLSYKNYLKSSYVIAYCTGLLLSRRVLKTLELDEEYEGNVEVTFFILNGRITCLCGSES